MLDECVRVGIQHTLCIRQSNLYPINHPPLHWDDPIRRDLRLLRFTLAVNTCALLQLKFYVH